MMDQVRQRETVDGRKLGEMMLASSAAAENYRALARCFQGWQARALLNMAREAGGQRTCLAGIRALVTGRPLGPLGVLTNRIVGDGSPVPKPTDQEFADTGAKCYIVLPMTCAA